MRSVGGILLYLVMFNHHLPIIDKNYIQNFWHVEFHLRFLATLFLSSQLAQQEKTNKQNKKTNIFAAPVCPSHPTILLHTHSHTNTIFINPQIQA